ncbi:MAG: hypothetical protein ACJA1B_001077 [Polaribacter sp.]|jgi:hypothetical protein
MKQILITIICLFLYSNCLSQIEDSQITIGTNHILQSTLLNQDRTIQIYVPEE